MLSPETASASSSPLRSAADAAYSPRLMSLDALRGFDMFWIVGGEDIVHALQKVNPSPGINFITRQLTHKNWEGVAFYDLIFPLFVFIVGVSLVFSLSKTIAREGKATAYQRVITRGVLLYLVGLFYYGGFSQWIGPSRLMGVLQRIALAYLSAGLIFCTFRLRGLVITCVGLLAGYWAVMALVPIRDISLEAHSLEQLKTQTGITDTSQL